MIGTNLHNTIRKYKCYLSQAVVAGRAVHMLQGCQSAGQKLQEPRCWDATGERSRTLSCGIDRHTDTQTETDRQAETDIHRGKEERDGETKTEGQRDVDKEIHPF